MIVLIPILGVRQLFEGFVAKHIGNKESLALIGAKNDRFAVA
jgi:hypothetical protein